MIWLTITFVLGLVFIVPVVLSMSLKMVPANVQPGFNYDVRLSIYRDRVFTQKFISKTANLTALGMSIRNPNLNNKAAIILNLYDMAGNIIRSVTISGMNLEDGSFTKFIFDPITDSLGKEYLFTIASPDAGPEETIELFIIGSDSSSGIIEYSYMGETYDGGTPIVSYNKPLSRWQTVRKIYSNLISRLLPRYFQTSN